MKYTDAQLSRILTAHANGELIHGGAGDKQAYPACLVQCGLEVFNVFEIDNESCSTYYRAYGGLWFDGNYDPLWTAEQFLTELEKEGLA